MNICYNLLLWVRIKLHLLFAQRRCLVAGSAAAAAVVAVAAAVAFVVGAAARAAMRSQRGYLRSLELSKDLYLRPKIAQTANMFCFAWCYCHRIC